MEDRILLRKPRKYPKGSSVILHENDDEYVTHIEDKFDNRHSRHTGNYFHKSGSGVIALLQAIADFQIRG